MFMLVFMRISTIMKTRLHLKLKGKKLLNMKTVKLLNQHKLMILWFSMKVHKLTQFMAVLLEVFLRKDPFSQIRFHKWEGTQIVKLRQSLKAQHRFSLGIQLPTRYFLLLLWNKQNDI